MGHGEFVVADDEGDVVEVGLLGFDELLDDVFAVFEHLFELLLGFAFAEEELEFEDGGEDGGGEREGGPLFGVVVGRLGEGGGQGEEVDVGLGVGLLGLHLGRVDLDCNVLLL